MELSRCWWLTTKVFGLQQLQWLQKFPGACDEYTGSAALNSCGQQSWSSAMQILEMIQEWRARLDLVSCSAAINACAKSAQWLRSTLLWQDMEETNEFCFSATVKAYEKEGWQDAMTMVADSRRHTRDTSGRFHIMVEAQSGRDVRLPMVFSVQTHEGYTSGQKDIDVLVLQPSGEAIFDSRLPKKTTVWELQKRISLQESISCPNKLTLLLGSQVLQPSLKLQELQLDGPLCLVRKAHRSFQSFVPSQEEFHGMKLQKCIILGEAFSGKTQFLRALAGDTFNEDPPTSCGLDFRVLHVASQGDPVDRKVKIKIWSARQMERLPDAFKTTFFDDAEGYFAVFSLANRKTFSKIRELVSHFRKAVPSLQAQRCALLIGTHEDVNRNRRQVSEEEAIRLATELDCAYQEVSSKTRNGIDEALRTWLDLYYDTYEEVGYPILPNEADHGPAA
ncbi:unnamed protein product [Durusdinium trenchii]|uniref:Uncharacterized protein n=1 Tax=Durusdinium trenchii TaxID=1381693 RepID=A0ABP0P8F7_9DINO